MVFSSSALFWPLSGFPGYSPLLCTCSELAAQGGHTNLVSFKVVNNAWAACGE